MNTVSLIGCDFSSSPSKRKPIVLALGQARQGRVQLQALQTFDTLSAFVDWLAQPADWVGGFDLPFGLPRELVETLGWPTDWAACMDHYCALERSDIREQFAAFCNARPVGGKFAHRAADRPAGSSPSMKWVNPPVAWMMHAGVPLLRAAQWTLPGMCEGRPDRVALEAATGALDAAALQLGVPELAAESLRIASQALERLVGRLDAERHLILLQRS